jgi:uncharacterized protein
MSSSLRHQGTGRGLALFFVLSLTISWLIWVPQAAATLGLHVLTIPLNSPLMLVAVWGPGLAAVLVALLAGGRTGLRSLFRPLRRWRVGAKWYLLVLLFPAMIWSLGRIVDMIRGADYVLRSPAEVFGPQQAVMLPFLILFALPSALGEEMGWRGYALPHLQTRYSALAASVILGLFWGLWHIPTLVAQGVLDLSLVALVPALLGPIPLAFVYTWIYNNAQRSLLIVWLFHTSDAVTQYILPRLPTATDEILVAAIAILLVVRAGPASLSSRRGQTSDEVVAVSERAASSKASGWREWQL